MSSATITTSATASITEASAAADPASATAARSFGVAPLENCSRRMSAVFEPGTIAHATGSIGTSARTIETSRSVVPVRIVNSFETGEKFGERGAGLRLVARHLP